MSGSRCQLSPPRQHHHPTTPAPSPGRAFTTSSHTQSRGLASSGYRTRFGQSQGPAGQPSNQDHRDEALRSQFDSLTSIGAPVYQRSSSGSGSSTHRGAGKEGGSGGSRAGGGSGGPIRDTDIRSRYIYLVDFTGAAGGGLTGPFKRDDILAKLDRKRFWLQQVSARPGTSKPPKKKEAESAAGEGRGEGVQPASTTEEAARTEDKADKPEFEPYPVCKLVDKKDSFDQARAAAERKAGPSSSSASSSKASSSSSGTGPTSPSPGSSSATSPLSDKDLQLTWSSTPHDISYKLAKAKRELLARAPNSRLTIRIATKRGSGRHVGVPGTAYHAAELARKREFLESLHAAVCSPDWPGKGTALPQPPPSLASSADTAAGGSVTIELDTSVPDGVAKLNSEGPQWRGSGSMAVLVYEPVV